LSSEIADAPNLASLANLEAELRAHGQSLIAEKASQILDALLWTFYNPPWFFVELKT
jgi:hypothetical protein